MKVWQAAKTDVGLTRDHNEDCYGFGPPEQAPTKGHLAIVCDGMGGHAAGEVASSLAVATIVRSYYHSDDPDRARALEASFHAANTEVYDRGRSSMGTTGVAALVLDNALHVANVGDSRAYLFRDGRLQQLTKDHSFVAEQVAAGILTPDEARRSIHKNVITRAIGYQPEVAVDLTFWVLRPGDLVLLSSDGLHSLVDDSEIATTIEQCELTELVDRLIVLANARGGSDNITAVTLYIADVEQALPPNGTPLANTTDRPATDAATTRRLEATPVAQQPARTIVELPLRLWGAVGASVAALMLLGLALWVVLDASPVAPPTSAPGIVPATVALPSLPPTTLIATPSLSPTPLLSTATARPTALP
jgi:PPM family protein phosphatase